MIRGPLRALAAAFAVLTLPGLSLAQAEPTLYATSPESGNSYYTDLYTLNTEGRVESYGAIGFNAGGGLAPLTVPITGLTYGGGLLYATSAEAGNLYTDLYTFNTGGRVESYGAIGFNVGGGLAPLMVPITALTYGEGSLYAISPEAGTDYTILYKLNTEGRVESYGALGFGVGGGLAPLMVPITALTYGEGSLYAISPEAGTDYTILYKLNTQGRVESYGALGFSMGGGLTPLTVPITGLTFDDGSLYATSPEAGTSYTSLYTLNTEGWVESYGAIGFNEGGGLAPLMVPITAIAGSVPEPSTWGMMLAGFASLGFVGVRARRTHSPWLNA